MAVCLASLLAGGAMADVVYFTDSSNINLLECWNPDGTSGLQLAGLWSRCDRDGNEWERGGYDPAYLTRLISCAATGTGARFDRGNTDEGNDNRWVEFTFTFDSPVMIDTLVTSWRRDANHCANNYQWLDGDRNVLVSVSSPTRFAGDSYQVDTLSNGPVTTSALTFKMYLDDNNNRAGDDPNFYHMAELLGLGAYLTSGNQQVAMDGRYNIFYEETNVTGDFDPKWTDHLLGDVGGKPNETGSCVWEFSREYELTGMVMTMYNDGRRINNAKVEVSDDGVKWDEIWFDAAYLHDSNNPYIQFAPDTTANFLRLSWSGITSPVEITEFQVFGKPAVPEPMTMTLLAVGGLALLRRRR